jgi:PAS domain S-box-containing protein
MPPISFSSTLDLDAAIFSPPAFDFQAWLDAWQDEIIFFRVDADDRIEYVSSSVERILGYAPDDMLCRYFQDYFDPAHPLCEELRDLSARMLAHDSPESKRCVARRRDGRYAFFLLTERDVYDHDGSYAGRETMAQEATRRVEAELWLRQSERKYRRLIEQFRGDYIIYTRDARGLITYVSPSIETLMGYQSSEVVGRNWRDILGSVEEKRRPVVRTRHRDGARHRFREVVVQGRRRDGALRVFEIQEWSLLGAGGRCLAIEGIAKDITDASEAEEEIRRLKDDLERRVALRTDALLRMNEDLRASEERYRNVVETQTEFIVRWTPDGRRTFVNEPYCRFIGQSSEALLGTSVMPTIHPDDRHLVDEFIAQISPEHPTSTGEARLFAADGSIRWTQWTSQAYFDKNGQAVEYQSVGRDVTELRLAADLLRQKEAHLAHLSRLATMGEMVAGIAHELSQPLHAAQAFAEAARRNLASGRTGAVDAAIDFSREISSAIQRTVEIIRRLRDFTKAQPVAIESLDLNDVVRGAVEMMTYEIRRTGAAFSIVLAEGLAPVAGDRIQLEQVCVNLLKNACEALEPIPLAERRLSVSTASREGCPRLIVKDSGIGLAGADGARLFDAFYSTKAEGMGMGLSLCKSIAEAHHMQISFAGDAGCRGMTFHVDFPHPEPPLRDKRSPPASTQPLAGIVPMPRSSLATCRP